VTKGIPHGWRVCSLEELGTIVTGKTPPTKHTEYYGGFTPFITPSDMDVRKVISATERYLTEAGVNAVLSCLVPDSTVFVSCIGSDMGKVGMTGKKSVTNQQINSVIVQKPNHSEYLYYNLSARKDELQRLAGGGSAQPILNKGHFSKLEIILPPPGEQRAIAHILGTLDDKIGLNRKMNETLEAVAQALFKNWFVDFEPFRDQGMEDSPLGPIPRGWSIGMLGGISFNPRRGVYPKEIKPSTPYIGLEHMPRKSIALSEWVQGKTLESNKFLFKKGEILFGKLRPYFHKVGVAPLDGVCSTDILVIAPNEPAWFGLTLGHVSSDEFVAYTDAGSTGTKMPRTNWLDMARFEIAVPPQPLAESFNKVISPLVDKIIGNIHESRTLASIRDALLPKLMSGEIQVKDVERFTTPRAEIVSQDTGAIYTIGHSNHSTQDFICLLKQHGITAVADVRSSPFSGHHPQFNRDRLSKDLNKEGIIYVFLGKELGARSGEPGPYGKGEVDSETIVARPMFKEGIDRLLSGKDKYRIALLCAEKEPLDCHRTIIVSRNLNMLGVPVKHILADGRIEEHQDTERRLIKLLGIENNLFDSALSDAERLDKAYNRQAQKIAYRPSKKEDNHEYAK